MAVDRVEQRLRLVTAALDAAGIPYAVVGGNAVAAWVGRVDPSATRATKDVDLLVDRADLSRITVVFEGLGFRRDDLRDLVMFIDPAEPSRRAGVHLVWAGDRVRPSYAIEAPQVTESVRDPQGFAVLSLPALVRMKLTSFRLVDQVHVQDLLRLGLIDDSMRSELPEVLRQRLEQIEDITEE
jgi:hypothetical protein